jgi:hypothetical protein
LPRRRFEYESRNVALLDLRVQAQGRPVAKLTGTLDSGATDTMLSIKDAEALGLNRTDLRRASYVTIADDTKVPSWTTDLEIRAQVQTRFSDGGPLQPWGPIINLHPIFMETGSPLWGQEDFCASFEITLQRYLLPAHFALEYWAGMSEGTPRP